MPPTDSIQIRIMDSERPIVFLLYSSERVAKIKRWLVAGGIRKKNTGLCPVRIEPSRNCWKRATRLPCTAQAGDIRTIRELLGHSDVRTTMIYTHMLNRKAVVCRGRRIGCSLESAIHVRTYGMTANTLAGVPGSTAESNVDSAACAIACPPQGLG